MDIAEPIVIIVKFLVHKFCKTFAFFSLLYQIYHTP